MERKMSEANAFLLIHATPNPENMDLLPEYLSSMGPVFDKYQGVVVSKFKVIEQLVGEGKTKMVAILSFLNAEVIRILIAGDEFKELAKLRARVFLKLDLLLSELM